MGGSVLKIRKLKPDEANSALAIQQALDSVWEEGGKVILPELDVTLDRGIELYSHVALCGQGEKTILRKGPGRVYPLTGYHNYGMCDVPLASTEGLDTGMTVSVYDEARRGFYETFARITWKDGNWIGLDHGIEADYRDDESPRLCTAYPMIFGHGIRNAAVRNITLDGRREDQEAAMGACRGAAVYLYKSRDVQVSGIRERDYHGEGLGFQMCRDIRIVDCVFNENTGNGLHPGAGSTNCIFEKSVGNGNGKSGFYFCVRANHITVEDCEFAGNTNGMSIGTRDCNNLIESCSMVGNIGPGILVRPVPPSCAVHSIRVTRSRIADNGHPEKNAQIEVCAVAFDLIFDGNEIATGSESPRAGILVGKEAQHLYCSGNSFEGCEPDVQAETAGMTPDRPIFECGYGSAPAEAFRHLPVAAE